MKFEDFENSIAKEYKNYHKYFMLEATSMHIILKDVKLNFRHVMLNDIFS